MIKFGLWKRETQTETGKVQFVETETETEFSLCKIKYIENVSLTYL